MSKRRPDLAPMLIEAAKLAARGVSTKVRDNAIVEMEGLPSLSSERSGAPKAAIAARLKQAVADLEGLDGTARTAVADKVVSLADQLSRMPDAPFLTGPLPEPRSRRYWIED